MRSTGILTVAVDAEVAFHDVDLARVTWHGHYLKYLENARWALMDRLGYGLDAMLASGYLWPIVDVQVKYIRATRFGNRLRVQASLVEWQSRLSIHYLITDTADGGRVARARTVQVAVESSTGELQFVSPAVLLDRVKLLET